MNGFLALALAVAADPNAPESPPLSDLVRFPPRQIVQQQREFSWAFRRQLGTWAIHCHGWQGYREVEAEAWALYRMWDRLDDAQLETRTEDARRRALEDLREMLGGQAYAAGWMPPAVPVWACRPLDW